MPRTIPVPTSGGMISEFVRAALSVTLTDGSTVLYQRDDAQLTSTLRHVRNGRVALGQMLDPIGDLAAQVEPGCGGSVGGLWSEIESGESAAVAAAVEAIPQLYQELRDPQDRRVLRGFWRHLTRAGA